MFSHGGVNIRGSAKRRAVDGEKTVFFNLGSTQMEAYDATTNGVVDSQWKLGVSVQTLANALDLRINCFLQVSADLY